MVIETKFDVEGLANGPELLEDWPTLASDY